MRCRNDARSCELRNTDDLPNVETYSTTLGAINCTRSDLDATSAECSAMGGAFTARSTYMTYMPGQQ